MSPGASGFEIGPYVPRLSAEWDLDAPGARWRQIEATCCFVDISGFTALSERLARHGRIGAEELTEVLNHVFSQMLGIAYAKGGALLKFGGDALLLAFTREDHPTLAAQAAVAMRAALRAARTLPTSVGRVNLKMSVGVHCSTFDLFRVGSSHQELLIAGPSATATTRMEQSAEASEIVVSRETAARLPRGAAGAEKGEGRLLKWRQVVDGGPGPIAARDVPTAVIETAIPAALRTRLADHFGASEHRLATVGFVKFQGVDDLIDQKGPEATADALQRVVSAIQEAADGESVTFLGSDIDANGGKIILVAGVPGTQEDDEGRLLRAAHAIVNRPLPLPVRIGVNRGYVFAGDIGTEYRRTFTIMGDAVNLAARLMAAASPGEVFTTAGVLEHSRTAFESDALEPLKVKGKAEPVQAYRIGAWKGPKSASIGTLPFRGRQGEMSSLVQRFATASAGQGQVVSIEGDRGAGKSRLTTELIASVDAPAVLLLQGEAYGAAVPYLPLRAPFRSLAGLNGDDAREASRRFEAWVRQADPDLLPFLPFLALIADVQVEPTPESQAVAEEFVTGRIADVVVGALDAACRTPMLILMDDAHWFDNTTSEICRRLAMAARERPWLVCVTRRPDEAGFSPEQPDVRLRLGALDDAAARELVEAGTEAIPLRPHERDGLVARAGGNPLFLEELLRIVRSTQLESLPDSLDAVAMHQIDSLPPQPRRMLLLASVLGRSFDRDLLSELLPSEELESGSDPLAGLEEHLIADRPNRLRFRHAVLQEAAYETLPFRTRLAMHCRVGEVIEAGESRMTEAAPLLSLHFFAAHEWARTWRYAKLAADTAKVEHAPGEAVAHLERAVTAARHLTGAVTDAERASVLTDLGTARELLGEYEAAEDAFRRADSVSSLDPLRRAELADRRAYIRSEYLGRPSAAIRQLRSAQARLSALELSGTDEYWIRALISAREADVRARQGRFADGLEYSKRAAQDAERGNNTRALALALAVQDHCLVLTGRSAEAKNFARVLELYQSLGDHVRVAVTLSNVAAAAYYNSQWELAATRFQEASEAFTKAGDLVHASFAELNLGDIRLNQGRWEEAAAILFSARRTLEACGYQMMAALAAMALGRARVFLGDVDTGFALLLSASSALDEVGSPMERLEVQARLAEALIFSGRHEEAKVAFEKARDLERASTDTPLSSLVDRIELSLAIATGETSSVMSSLDPALERARQTGADYEVLMMRALAQQAGSGDGDEETARLRQDLGVMRLPMIDYR